MPDWKIVVSEVSIIGPVAGHRVITIYDGNGNIYEQFNGLATRNGEPIIIGYLPGDKLRGFTKIYDGEYFQEHQLFNELTIF